jgi:hypothetical protein
MRYAYFGHHKCASTWIVAILYSLCREAGLTFNKYNELAGRPLHTFDVIADTGANADHLREFSAYTFRGFHVIRDPRDIVISAYFSHKFSHPDAEWLTEQRQLLKRVDLPTGIRHSIDFRAKQFREMAEWNYKHPGVYESRFETITADPLAEFSAILRFLGWMPDRIRETVLIDILEAHQFQRLTDGRPRGEEDPLHHYRKGLVGDWKRYLTGDNKDYFKATFGPLLQQLAYEGDLDW